MNEYSPKEERLNVISHAIGLVLSIAALVALLIKTVNTSDIWKIISACIFGLSLIILYTASTLYHNAKAPRLRSRLKIFDHAAIYILIAGSYTPFTLVALQGSKAWWLFGLAWGMALIGIVLKLFFTGRFKSISTLMYVFMGWIIIFAINPLIENLAPIGLRWLIAGGIAYTLGAVLYSIKKIKFNHAIFHVFVLIGSFCHFVSIYCFVLTH